VVDALMSDLKFDVFQIVAAHIVVSVVIGEVAAGDFKPDTVTSLEDVGARHNFDVQLVNLPGDNWLRAIVGIEWTKFSGAFLVLLSVGRTHPPF
jgi:hypothetical protein